MSVLARAGRRVVDFDDDGVVQEPVERGGEYVVAEDVAPIPGAAVG